MVDALVAELCRSSRLRLTLITTEPTTLLRTHNASDPTTARTYLKRFARGREEAQFVLWSEGENATKVWRSLNQYLDVDKNDRLFLPLKNPPFPERLQENWNEY